MRFSAFAVFQLVAGLLCTSSLAAPVGADIKDVILYQAEDVLEPRLGSMANLNDYIERLRAVCTKYFASDNTPETLDVVVAIRPGRLSRVWLVSSTHPSSDPEREPLRKELESVSPCEVRDGPIAFALVAKIGGGDGKNPSKGDKSIEQPFPQEWVDVADGQPGALLVPDDILDIIWPVHVPTHTAVPEPRP